MKDLEIEDLINEAKSAARTGVYSITENFLERAEELSRATKIDFPRVEEILKTAYENGITREIKTLKEYLKEHMVKIETITNKLNNVDYCANKLGRNTNNEEREILQLANLEITAKYIKTAEDKIKEKDLPMHFYAKAKAEERARKARIDITSEIALINQIEKNQPYRNTNLLIKEKGPHREYFLN